MNIARLSCEIGSLVGGIFAMDVQAAGCISTMRPTIRPLRACERTVYIGASAEVDALSLRALDPLDRRTHVA